MDMRGYDISTQIILTTLPATALMRFLYVNTLVNGFEWVMVRLSWIVL